MIDQELLSFLASLNTGAGSRIYLGIADANAFYPYVVVRRAGGYQPLTTQGNKLWPRTDFEIGVYAATHADTYAVTNTIKNALNGFRGVMGVTRVHFARLMQLPDHVAEVTGDVERKWTLSLFQFMHEE